MNFKIGVLWCYFLIYIILFICTMFSTVKLFSGLPCFANKKDSKKKRRRSRISKRKCY